MLFSVTFPAMSIRTLGIKLGIKCMLSYVCLVVCSLYNSARESFVCGMSWDSAILFINNRILLDWHLCNCNQTVCNWWFCTLQLAYHSLQGCPLALSLPRKCFTGLLQIKEWPFAFSRKSTDSVTPKNAWSPGSAFAISSPNLHLIPSMSQNFHFLFLPWHCINIMWVNFTLKINTEYHYISVWWSDDHYREWRYWCSMLCM